MIKKFLIYGKQLYFASQPPEAHLEIGKAFEVKMPIEVFWDAEKLLKKIHYLQSSGEPQSEVNIHIRNLFQLVTPFCFGEMDRAWMRDKFGDDFI